MTREQKLKRALLASQGLLEEFLKGECCDHEVNICYCAAFAQMEENRELLKDPEDGGAI